MSRPQVRPTRDGFVLFVAASSWDGVQGSDRHLAEQLARRVPVLWVDPPISVMTPLRNPRELASLRRRGFRPASPGLVRFTPVTVPGRSRPGLRRLGDAVTRRSIRRRVRSLGRPVLATVVASHDDLLDVAPGAVSLLYGTDDWAAGAELMGLDRSWLEAAGRRQLRKADVVVTVSTVLRDTWSVHRPGIEVVPNGCDAEGLLAVDDAPPAADLRLTGPVAGVVGNLSDRIDLDYLEAVSDAGVSLLLVGPRQGGFRTGRAEALLARPSVQWVDSRPFAQLPGYLQAIDVGLTPYTDTPFNRASFPLKTLEYLAAGRAAVSTDLPASRWLDTDLVRIAGTPASFAAAVLDAVTEPRTEGLMARRRAFAAEHSWARRADHVAGLLGLPAVEPVPVSEVTR